ncbi:hypothetical protein PAPYR_3515 [Paratrimastix pyriformis]|uniref:Endonuclease/exonuclease/phosphatase domain-containing protein n=1 Tax=Paratrimastix pyriformis TaxID=342808 RepID=A0ABQ8UMR6_9EUKA|nr:hypothetical protein PAPYR_3515 [Paratrimastix pyriformis]
MGLSAAQEVDFFAELRASLGREWEGIFKQRTSARKSKSDGCAFFYRRSRLHCVAECAVELNDVARMLGLAPGTEGCQRMERDNIGQLFAMELPGSKDEAPGQPSRKEKKPRKEAGGAPPRGNPFPLSGPEATPPAGPPPLQAFRFVGLKPRAPREAATPRRLLFVANTHLFWDPRCSDVKQEQARFLVWALQSFRAAVLSRLGDEAPPCPCRDCGAILCGDFNSQPIEPVYRLLTAEPEAVALGPLPPVCAPTGPLGAGWGPVLPFRSGMAEVLGAEPPWTNYTEFKARRPSHPLTQATPHPAPGPRTLGLIAAVLVCPSTGRVPVVSRAAPLQGGPPPSEPPPSQLRCVGVLGIPPHQQLALQHALPSDQFPSDHISLRAFFELAE